ncbi:TPA: hypothetical protein I7737_13130 [Vibrio vulnificus]|nr:hypothetical protein [Vibrio vulnificus]
MRDIKLLILFKRRGFVAYIYDTKLRKMFIKEYFLNATGYGDLKMLVHCQVESSGPIQKYLDSSIGAFLYNPEFSPSKVRETKYEQL